MASLNSLSAATKFVPVVRTHDGNLTSPAHKTTNCINAGVRCQGLSATSMCTALRVRQVNTTPYLLTVLRPRLTSNGPKKSTPVFVKGGLSGKSLLQAGLPSFVPNLSLILRHTVHLLIIFRNSRMACGIHYLHLSCAKT